MKTARDIWSSYRPNSQSHLIAGVPISIEGIERIQQDAQAHLLERIRVLEVELEFLKGYPSTPLWIKDRCKLALATACGIDGEAKEHPAVARVKELEVELSIVNEYLKANDGVNDGLHVCIEELNDTKVQLTQRDNALKLAGEALVSLQHDDGCYCEASFAMDGAHPSHSKECRKADSALAAIKACGVEL